MNDFYSKSNHREAGNSTHMFSIALVKRPSIASLSGFILPVAVVLIVAVVLNGSPFRGPVLMLLVWLALCHAAMRWFSRTTTGDEVSVNNSAAFHPQPTRRSRPGPYPGCNTPNDDSDWSC